MMVRLIVRLQDRDAFRRLVHGTVFEPSCICPEKCKVEFVVPFRSVKVILDRLSESGVGEYLAHLAPVQK